MILMLLQSVLRWRSCVEEGCQVIFATSWGYMDYVEEMAEEYPEVMFAHGTGYKSNGKNFIKYFGKINQARYLSGIAAGLKTASNKIGYVAAQNSENGEVTSGVDAFAMGVESVNPDAKVYVKVTGSWFDPEGEGQAAKSLIDLGCDVIAQHCDTANPATEAEKAGVYAVGYNSDMSEKAPGATLTSVVWDWSVFYTEAVKNVIEGTWDGKDYFGSMQDGLVTLSPLSDLCAEGTKEKVQEVQDKIMSGEWDIFDGTTEYEDNQGEKHTLRQKITVPATGTIRTLRLHKGTPCFGKEGGQNTFGRPFLTYLERKKERVWQIPNMRSSVAALRKHLVRWSQMMELI